MELKTNQTISNEINTSLQSLPEYFLNNFVEDCVKINTILNSELRNQMDFKACINLLRVILRDNKDLFCPLFQNLKFRYLLILEKENLVPEEYIFLLVDIIQNKQNLKKYYEKWINDILEALMLFIGDHMDEKGNSQIINICRYIQFFFDYYISLDDDHINKFMEFFGTIDTTKYLKLKKYSELYFFKYIYLYDINKIKLINWKFFFDICASLLDNNSIDEENKKVIIDIFKQIYIYFQKVNVDPNDALAEGGSISAAKYFEQINNFNTEKAKELIRENNIEV